MRMQFKYKFILSFAMIEIFFISLIVFFNFSSLNSLSKSLIDEKIETATTLFTQIVKTPLITYDLATIDNGVESFIKIKNLVGVKVLDKQNRIISHLSNEDYDFENIFIGDTKEVHVNGRSFKKLTTNILFNGEVLGSTTMVFEITESLKIIEHNRKLTFMLVVLEILLSILVAYIIGYRLTKSLTILTDSAQKIAQDDHTPIPHLPSKGDEISVLSDTLRQMQQNILQRSAKLTRERNFYTALLNQASSIILVMNAKGQILLSNKITEELTGYSQAELQGKRSREVFMPINMQDDTKITSLDISADNFPKSNESDWRIKDGSRLTFACSHSSLPDENGDLEYLITVAIDVTEKNAVNQKIRALLNSPLDSITLISIDGTILEINEIAANRLGIRVEELKGKKLFDYSSPANAQLREEQLSKLISSKKSLLFEEIQNGNHFKTHFYPILDNEGNVIQASIFSHDVTMQRRAEKELNTYMQLVDENVLISHTDLRGVMTNVSQAFCRISGYTREELIGDTYNILRDPQTPSLVYKDLWKTIQDGNIWHGEIRNIAKDGSFYWIEASIYPDYDENGKIIGYNAIRLDITSKKLLEELSITDALTKLYNRRYFDEIFQREINKTKRDKKIFCLLSLDVDDFKLYNDTYGHQMGDDVLSSIAYVLKQNMKRATDIAFRIGGEEFSAIYVVENEEDAYRVAETIRSDIEAQKIEHTGNSASNYVTASFGVIYINFAIQQDVASDKITLYKKADELLYKAKASGKNRVVVESLT